MDVTGHLIIRNKVPQRKDNLTADIADSDKAFKVNLRLSIKLKVRTCLFRFTKTNLSTLNTTLFKIIRFKYFIVRCFKFGKTVKYIT